MRIKLWLIAFVPLSLLFLIESYEYPKIMAQTIENKKVKPIIECNISVQKIIKSDDSKDFAICEIEFKNVSDSNIHIFYTKAPALLQYVELEKHWPDGKRMKYKYTDQLAPYSSTPTPAKIIFRAGDKINYHCCGLGGSGPGVYKVQAFFKYEKLEAISSVLEVELK